MVRRVVISEWSATIPSVPPPHDDGDLPSGVVRQQLVDRARGVVQRVEVIDDPPGVARLEQRGEGSEVLAVYLTGHGLHAGGAPPHEGRPRHPW